MPQDERERFETWAKQIGLPLKTEIARMAWWAWEARARQVDSTPGYRYRYTTTDAAPLRYCPHPDCHADLTAPASVTVFYNVEAQLQFFYSQLTATGLLIDQSNLMRQGRHSDTVCRSCSVSLNDHDEVEEHQCKE
jgi:hypothetical protein